MKFVILLCALSVGAMVVSHVIDSSPCPPGEHPRPDCPQFYEPTCESPTEHPLRGKMARICPRPVCFCDKPTVRDMNTRKCVPINECILP